ncbi:CHAT domain-containing protein [Brevundimonas sp.]
MTTLSFCALHRTWAAVAALCLMAMTTPALAQTHAEIQNSPTALMAEAFVAAQWAIASDTSDALTQMSARFAQGDDALGQLAQEREELAARRDRLERTIEGLPVAPAQAEATNDSRSAYRSAAGRIAAIDAEIESRFPAYSELTRPQALSITETQGLLRDDEALLLVLVNPEATYVWAVSRDRAEWARAESLGDTAMTDAVARLRESLTGTAASTRTDIDPTLFAARPVTSFDRALSHRLYAELIRPVEGVFEGKTTLMTVVTGALTALPLSVLSTAAPVTQATDVDAADPLVGTSWLIDRYALASLPSVSSLKALRCYLVEPEQQVATCPARTGTQGYRERFAGASQLVAFGAPRLDGPASSDRRGSPDSDALGNAGTLADVAKLRALPALPGSRLELETLKTRYPSALIRMGADATEAAVRSTDAEALSHARFIVFSTHGLIAGVTAKEPGLVLTPPPLATAADDGYLTASEAALLKLNADFVVLSACNTAASDGRPGAEGLSGLARAFFYAGARSVLVSHWEVSDAATTTLITGTFAHLDAKTSADPATRAQALQAGIRAVRAERRWQHPAYWAAFTLVGDPG